MPKICKFFIWTFSVFIAACFLGCAALPSIISTPAGTKIAIRWINSHIKGTLAIEKLKLSWLGKQHLEKLQLKDNKGSILASCEEFETDTSLLYLLLTGGHSFKSTHIQSPYIYIYKDTKETSQERAITGENKKKRNLPRFRLPIFKEDLKVTQGIAVFASDTKHSVTFQEINLNKDFSSNHFAAQASTAEGGIQGAIDLEAVLDERSTVNLVLKNFPVSIVDNLLDSHLCVEALGPALNLELQLAKEKEQMLLVNGSAKSANLTAYVEGKTDQDRFVLSPKTHLHFSITPSFFKQVIHPEKRKNWELAKKINLTFQIENGVLPLREIESFKDIALKAKGSFGNAKLQHAQFGTYSLKQFDLSLAIADQIQLAYQGTIQGKGAAKLAGTVSFTPAKELLFDYSCHDFPVALLELASPKLEQKFRLLVGKQFDLEGRGRYDKEILNTDFTLKGINTQLIGHVEGQTSELNFNCTGEQTLHGKKAKMLGSSINFSIDGLAKCQSEGFYIPFLKGHLFNPFIDCNFGGQIGQEGHPLSLDKLHILATGNIKKLPIENEFSEPTFQNAALFLQLDGSKNLISAKIENPSVNASCEIKGFIEKEQINLNQADIHFSCDLNDFQTRTIAPLVVDNFDLSLLLGQKLTLTSTGTYTPRAHERLTLDVNGQGQGFSTAVSMTLDETLKIKQNKPSYLYWEMTPERYNALMRFFVSPNYSPPYALLKPTKIELNIVQLTCPTAEQKNLSHFLCQSGCVGDFSIGTTLFRHKQTGETLAFEQMRGDIKGENFSEAINLAFSGRILGENLPQSNRSTFVFSGQMLNFWTKQGKFNREHLSVKGDLALDLLPIRPFTSLFPMHPETRAIMQAVLGELANARITGEISQLSGPITIDIKSSNFKAKLPLLLKKNALYLRDYIDAEITLTQAVNETLLKDISPILIVGAYSDHPLKIYIDPQGFMLPIRPYCLENMQIGNAVFDIGKIRVRNGGQIQSLMQFLNAKDISPDGFMEAWFTPIYMSVHNGVASYKRFDALLASNVHIAMWGGVNLGNDHVNMTLAIAPKTLYERFKIKGLTKKEMFEVQMSGTTSKLELDWSSAYSRIAWIVARNATGQIIGNILGGILEQLVTKPGAELPPPTTDPLPWESFYPS